jgi:hypothetical protein
MRMASSKPNVIRLDRTTLKGRMARGKYTLLSRYPEDTTLPAALPTELPKKFQMVRPAKK